MFAIFIIIITIIVLLTLGRGTSYISGTCPLNNFEIFLMLPRPLGCSKLEPTTTEATQQRSASLINKNIFGSAIYSTAAGQPRRDMSRTGPRVK